MGHFFNIVPSLTHQTERQVQYPLMRLASLCCYSAGMCFCYSLVPIEAFSRLSLEAEQRKSCLYCPILILLTCFVLYCLNIPTRRQSSTMWTNNICTEKKSTFTADKLQLRNFVGVWPFFFIENLKRLLTFREVSLYHSLDRQKTLS